MQRRIAFWDVLLPAVTLTGVLAAGFFVSDVRWPGTNFRPFCLVHAMTGVECPGCGLTRAFLLIPKGELLAAIHHNAAAPALYLLFVVAWMKSILRFFGKKLPGQNSSWKKWQAGTGLAVVVLMLGHWGFKLNVFFASHDLAQVIEKMKSFQLFGG